MADPTPRRRTLRDALEAHRKAAEPAVVPTPPPPQPAPRPAKAKKKGKAPPPGPDAAGHPWCPGCKAHHRPPASKDDWRAMGCQGANPFPAPKPPPQPTHARRDKRMAQAGRLPDGATFALVYDGGKQQWSGTLLVRRDGPALDPDRTKTFRDSASGVFSLLVNLDGAYRVWAKKHAPAPPDQSE